MSVLSARDFLDLKNNDFVKSRFSFYTPPNFAYSYVGINMRKPILEDVRVRRALAHIVNVDKIIEVIEYGEGERVVGPISKMKSKYYNWDIVPYEYNPDKARELLKEAGAVDTDGDGVLEIKVGSVYQPLKFSIKYNAENQNRAKISQMIKEEARKVGIQIDILPREWSVFLKELKSHDFDLYVGAWISTPLSEDHKQIWHTSSYNGGSNYVGFGNETSDKIIEEIRRELDESKRAILHKRLQEIIHEQVPYIFLYSPRNKLVIHKRFVDVIVSAMRPGFWAGSFRFAGERAQ